MASISFLNFERKHSLRMKKKIIDVIYACSPSFICSTTAYGVLHMPSPLPELEKVIQTKVHSGVPQTTTFMSQPGSHMEKWILLFVPCNI